MGGSVSFVPLVGSVRFCCGHGNPRLKFNVRKCRSNRAYSRGVDAEATSADDAGDDNGEERDDDNDGPQVEEMD